MQRVHEGIARGESRRPRFAMPNSHFDAPPSRTPSIGPALCLSTEAKTTHPGVRRLASTTEERRLRANQSNPVRRSSFLGTDAAGRYPGTGHVELALIVIRWGGRSDIARVTRSGTYASSVSPGSFGSGFRSSKARPDRPDSATDRSLRTARARWRGLRERRAVTGCLGRARARNRSSGQVPPGVPRRRAAARPFGACTVQPRHRGDGAPAYLRARTPSEDPGCQLA
jgi:hypothetical protein